VEIEDDGSDVDSDTDPSRPPTRLLASDYDSLVCRDCVLAIPILKSWAGTPGLMMLVKKRGADPDHPLWEVIGRQANDDPTILPEPGTSGTKRKQPDTDELIEDQLPKKQVKLETGRSDTSCQAPVPNPIAQSILNDATVNSNQQTEYEGTGDVFLASGFRTKWCTCPQVSVTSLGQAQAKPSLVPSPFGRPSLPAARGGDV
jgi:E3 ubiquitin-protein ligase UBR7